MGGEQSTELEIDEPLQSGNGMLSGENEAFEPTAESIYTLQRQKPSPAIRTRSSSSDVISHLYSQDSPKNRDDSPKHNPRRRRSFSQGSEDEYGWFEDFESPYATNYNMHATSQEGIEPMQRAMSLPLPPVTEPPLYVLESSLPTQRLWYEKVL